jgi:hypothetical protein
MYLASIPVFAALLRNPVQNAGFNLDLDACRIQWIMLLA